MASPSPTSTSFLCKSVLFGFFLIALPLFPSQAPEFVKETVLTKFWELIHLLFVGIAVAYGLFSRRNVESDVELRMMSCVDESSLSYVSRVLQVSSVFDEEEELETSSSFVETGRGHKKAESLSEYGEMNQVQAWNSKCFQGRSKVVVARPAYGVDGHVVYQSLGLPVRSLRSALRDNVAVSEDEKGDESLVGNEFDEVVAAPSSPWHSSPEMMAMGDDYTVDETRFTTVKSGSSRSSASSSSSDASFESHDQNRFSPSRSVSQESLNSNVDEPVMEKSLQGSSRSSSSSPSLLPSLPPSPSLSPSPPSPPAPELVNNDTHRRVLHSRHYSHGSLLEEDTRRGFEDELDGSKVRGGFSKKETGSKSLKLAAESSKKGKNKSRRSYPPDLVADADHSTTRRHGLQQKSDDHLFEDSIESEHNKLRIKKGRSHDSLELTETKASRRALRSSRGGGSDTLLVKDNKRNKEDDSEGYDKSSPRREPQSWRATSKVPSRGKSVRTIRPDRHEDSSEDSGRTKPRRQWEQELAIVLHEEKLSETLHTSEPEEEEEEDDVMEETEVEQPQVTLDEEEAAWESQSNASHGHHEVDRKADEFIAKFREQIRLQKLHSGEQRRGRGSIGIIRNSHFR